MLGPEKIVRNMMGNNNQTQQTNGRVITIDTGELKRRLANAVSNVPNLEKASGRVDIKVSGQPKRTITFTIE